MKYAFLLLSSAFIFSCSDSKVDPKIRVSGEGKVRAMPDLVILTLDVSFTKPQMADAVSETQSTVDSVVSILKSYSKRQTDIQISNITADKSYIYEGSKQVFVGYNASQTIDFVLKDLDRFSELTSKILGTRISSIDNVQFGHSKADSLFREADLLAYDDAYKSAEKLAARANVSLGKVIYISNQLFSSDDNSTVVLANNLNTFNKANSGQGITITPQVLEFRRSVQVEYSLK